MKKKKVELVLNGEGLDNEELTKTCKNCSDTETMEQLRAHKWASDIQWNSVQGPSDVCTEGELDNDDMPAWTKKAIWEDLAGGA